MKRLYIYYQFFFIFILPYCLYGVTSTWTDASGNWNTGANWSTNPVVPNAFDDGAIFPVPAVARTITLDVSPTVGTLTVVGGASNYIFTPLTATIHMNGTAPILSSSGNPATFNCLVSLDATTTINSGTFILFNVPGTLSGTGSLILNGTGLVQISTGASYTGTTTLTAGSLMVATVNALPTTTALTINGGTLTLNSSSQSVASLAGGGGSLAINGPPSPTPPVIMTVGSDDTSTACATLISGTGQLTKVGLGTLTLTGANTYNRGTNINNGAISISADNRIGTGNITLNGGALQTTASFSTAKTITLLGPGTMETVGAGTTTTCTGQISGSGSLTKIGAGTLLLSFANTFIGDTIVNVGTLRMGIVNGLSNMTEVKDSSIFDLNSFNQNIGSLSGSGSVILGNATLSTGNDDLSTIFSGNISGNGGVTKLGNGIFTLSGINSYIGPTTITSGSLQAAIANTLTTSTAVTVNGAFDLNNFDQSIGSILGSGNVMLEGATLTTGNDGNNTTFSGVISGGGGNLIKTGGGIFTLSGVNTYTGTTSINAGTLRTAIASALSSSTAVNVVTTFDVNDFSQNIGSLIGAGSVTLGSSALTTLATGNDNTPTTFSGIISGSGGLTKVGTGIFTLSGSNTYTGATTINGGELKMAMVNALSSSTAVIANSAWNLNDFDQFIGSLSGSGSVALGGLLASTLTTGNDNTSTTFSGSISGGGGLIKVGSGIFTLSGANTYMGTSLVNAGELSVTGSITGSGVIVQSGASLGGTGTVNSNILVNGSIKPGNSIGTLHVVGDVTLVNGSILVNEFNPNATDLLDVVGGVSIQPGATVYLIPDLGMCSFKPFQRFTIIQTTAKVVGRFNNVVSAFPSFTYSLDYDNEYVVDLIACVIPFSSLVSGGNPGSVAAYFDSIMPTPEGSDLNFVEEQLQTLQVPEMRKAFNQMHCALYKGAILSQENNFFRLSSILKKRTANLYQTCCNEEFYKNKKISIWATPFYNCLFQSGLHDLIGFGTQTEGVALGFDDKISSSGFLGFAGGYSFSDIDWKNKQGHCHINSFYGSLYHTYFFKSFFLNTSLTGAFSNFQKQRKIRFAEIHRTAKSMNNGAGLLAHIDSGYRGKIKQLTFNPFASLDFNYMHEDGFTETEARSLNLVVQKANYYMFRLEIGANFSHCFTYQNRKWIPDFKISYIREQRMHGGNYQSHLVDQKGSFTVTGLKPERNVISPGFSITTICSENDMISLKYDGEFGEKYSNNFVSLQLIHSF